MADFVPLLAYIGPETVLPIVSALAAVGGAFLAFGGRIMQVVRWCLRRPDRSVPAETQE